jgi:hypothetical protein
MSSNLGPGSVRDNACYFRKVIAETNGLSAVPPVWSVHAPGGNRLRACRGPGRRGHGLEADCRVLVLTQKKHLLQT